MRAVSASISALRHSAAAVAEGLLVAAIIATLVMAFAPVYKPADWLTGGDVAAGRGGGRGGGSLAAGAGCSVTPDPVTVGERYTATATGLTPGTFLNVKVSGSGGSNLFMRVADGDGVASVSWYANWPGTNTVKFMADNSKGTVLSSCSFSVS